MCQKLMRTGYILLLSGLLLSVSIPVLSIRDDSPSIRDPSNGYSPVAPAPGSVSKVSEIMDLVTEDLVKNFLESIVAFGPRVTGTATCKAAAAYIYHHFTHMGLHTSYHNWSMWEPGLPPRVISGSNVVATLPGLNQSSDRIVIFNAHYDTVKESPGADDDGSGVASVLAAASVLSQFQFEQTLTFITFSGEEDGLLGSSAYARGAYDRDDNILVALNADMIGYTETGEGGHKIRLYGTEDASWIMDKIAEMNGDYSFDYEITRRTISGGQGGGSDYYSFLQYGYDAIAVFEGEWNTNMHSSLDNLDNINLSYLTKNTRLITGVLATLADDTTFEYPQGKITFPQRGRLYINGVLTNTFPTEKTIVVDDITFEVEAHPGSYPLQKVEFYYDDTLKSTRFSPPYQWHMDLISFGRHDIEVKIYDENGKVTGDWMPIFSINLLRSP